MKWFGPQVPVLPLTVEKIQGVAAQFKRGRYRSFSNYVQRMKDEHEEQGHIWTRPLARTMKKCVRSCERGIGPARQSGVFNIPDVRAQNFPHDPLVEGGPISPGEMLEVGPFYGKRGIELELALYTSYRLTHKNTLVVFLAVTKTDPRALGTYRTWGCTCEGKRLMPCPVCAWKAHDEELRRRFGDRLQEPGFPAWPNAVGGVVSKTSVVRTIERVAERLHVPVTNDSGGRIFGEHSMRVSGAVHLTHIGIELYLLQILFRWKSELVLRYAGEAPLGKLTQKYIAGQANRTLEQVESTIFQKVADMVTQQMDSRLRSISGDPPLEVEMLEKPEEGTHTSLTTEVQKVELTVNALRQEIIDLSAEMAANVIEMTKIKEELRDRPSSGDIVGSGLICSDFGVVHKVLIKSASVNTTLWRCKCGWKFGTSVYEDVSTIPDNPNFVCGTCLPEEKEAARLRMPVGVALASAGRGQRPQAMASSASSSGQTTTPVTVESSEGDGEETSDDESAPIAALNQAASAATVDD